MEEKRQLRICVYGPSNVHLGSYLVDEVPQVGSRISLRGEQHLVRQVCPSLKVPQQYVVDVGPGREVLSSE